MRDVASKAQDLLSLMTGSPCNITSELEYPYEVQVNDVVQASQLLSVMSAAFGERTIQGKNDNDVAPIGKVTESGDLCISAHIGNAPNLVRLNNKGPVVARSAINHCGVDREQWDTNARRFKGKPQEYLDGGIQR